MSNQIATASVAAPIRMSSGPPTTWVISPKKLAPTYTAPAADRALMARENGRRKRIKIASDAASAARNTNTPRMPVVPYISLKSSLSISAPMTLAARDIAADVQNTTKITDSAMLGSNRRLRAQKYSIRTQAKAATGREKSTPASRLPDAMAGADNV